MRYLAAIIITFVAACATEDVTDIETARRPDVPAIETDRDCTQACRVAFGLCDATSVEDRQLLASCTQSCPFSDAELACYASSSCGSSPDCGE